MPNLAEFQDLASIATSRSVSLSPSSLALLRCALEAIERDWEWQGAASELSDSEADYVDEVVSLAVYELTQEVIVPEQRPVTVWLPHYASKSSGGTPMTGVISAGQFDAFYAHQVPAADRQTWLSMPFVLQPGTYTVNINTVKNSVSGIVNFYLDSTFLGGAGVDLYRSSVLYNNILTYTGVTVDDSPYHVITGGIMGKNASSTGYECLVSTMWIEREF